MEFFPHPKLADRSPALLASFDDAGHFRWANAAWARELAWTPDALRGRAFDDLVHADDLDALYRARADAASAPWSARHRARLRHRDGGWRWIDWFVAAFARGRLAAREPLAEGPLAAGVGLEMSDPLTFITANVDEVVEELERLAAKSPAELQRSLLVGLAEVRSGVDHLARIVRDLRGFAAEEASPGPASLHAAIQMSVDLAQHALHRRATCVVERVDVPRVSADLTRVAQALASLLVNAAQSFAAPDATRNVVTVRARYDGDAHVTMTVTDNGPGVAPDALPRIYEPFFSTKPPEQCAGLGLSVSQSIVHSLGGELSCASAAGEGAAFAIRLRVVAPSSDPPRAKALAPGDAGHVVVVDDEPVLVEGLRRVLQGQGYSVVGYHDARAALAGLTSATPDVTVCDLMMPHLTGRELHEAVARRRPDLAPRFVFMTGGVTRDDLRTFAADVGCPCLAKPLDLAKLLATLRSARARCLASV